MLPSHSKCDSMRFVSASNRRRLVDKTEISDKEMRKVRVVKICELSGKG